MCTLIERQTIAFSVLSCALNSLVLRRSIVHCTAAEVIIIVCYEYHYYYLISTLARGAGPYETGTTLFNMYKLYIQDEYY